MMASIDEFLITGRLGELAVGMDHEAVRALLGEPEATSRRKSVEVWKYGALQLGFHRDPFYDEPLLTTINLYFHAPEESIPERVRPDGWRPSDEVTVDTLKEHIDQYDPEKYRGIEQASAVVPLNSGVRATFEGGRLYGLHYQSRGPEVKQLTLFLPEDVLETLRREATGRSVSVAAVCASWIKERADQLRVSQVR